MECGICARTGHELSDVGIHCASCARTLLYSVRIEQARTLLEKSTLNEQLESVALGTRGEKRLEDTWSTESNKIKANQTRAKVEEKQQAISDLKQQVENLKEDIERKRADIKARTATLKTTKGTLAGQDKGQRDRLKEKMARGSKNLESIHQHLVQARTYLCREAATLMRFRHGKPRGTSNPLIVRYIIGGIPITDLKSINGMRCSEITAMLSSFSRLVCQVAMYAGVRLPAEITLPHRNYPLATINTPANSYLSAKPEFPGSGSSLAMTDISRASESRGLSRPRPLFLGSDDRNELVSDLARKDPSAFKFFIEAVALLAWDITWLAHAQGLSTGNETWSDVCNLGSSLWSILFASHRPSVIRRALSRQVPMQPESSRSRSSTPPVEAAVGQLGAFSHDSASHSLAAASRMAHARTLRLSKYTMIADPLRKTLENEMKNAEWEVLQDDEILDGAENFDDAVVIPTRNMDDRHYDVTRSLMTTTTHIEEPVNGKPKGTSGWTKLHTKNRD